LDWKAHVFIGCLFGAVGGSGIFGLDGAKLALFIAISGVAALLPDLDLRKSKFSQLLYVGVAVAILAAAYALSERGARFATEFAAYAIFLTAAALLLDLLFRPRHRGVMHGLAFLLAITAGAWLLLGLFFASAIFLGYASHLAADMCIKL